MRAGVRKRRERTRHLIQLGGLVQKAGLVDLTDDDRATLFGAFLELAERLRDPDLAAESGDAGGAGTDPGNLAIRWRRRGLRAFNADKQAAALGSQDDSRSERET